MITGFSPAVLHRTFIVIVLVLMQVSLSYAGTTRYEYDELDRLRKVWFDSVNYIEYAYDEIGNLLSKTLKGNVVSITATSTGGGRVYPYGTTTLLAGGNLTYSFIPDDGQSTATVYVDGVLQGQRSSYSFTNVTANHTVSATFGILPVGTLPVRLFKTNPVYFNTVQEAYNAAVNNDIIQAKASLPIQNLYANRNITVTVDGGYTADFSSNPYITMIGDLQIDSGTIFLNKLDVGK